jgi:hypothetical protein
VLILSFLEYSKFLGKQHFRILLHFDKKLVQNTIDSKNLKMMKRKKCALIKMIHPVVKNKMLFI